MGNVIGMKKHLSRRELTRRMEQGREAMRVLAAAVVESGGHLRIRRDTYASVNTQLTVQRDSLTGDLLLYTYQEKKNPEMTFEEIRAKYGPKSEGAEPQVENEADGETGSPGD